MSNTCDNTLVLTGPRVDRDRFLAEVAAAQPWELLAVHVPLNGRTPGDAWGTDGVKYSVEVPRHDDAATEVVFSTAWSPPYKWCEDASARFPTLTFELFCGSMESGFGGYILAHDGDLSRCERITSGFAKFFAERGRPGVFVPYWESADESDIMANDGGAEVASAATTVGIDHPGAGEALRYYARTDDGDWTELRPAPDGALGSGVTIYATSAADDDDLFFQAQDAEGRALARLVIEDGRPTLQAM
jgi:hypothetical protein